MENINRYQWISEAAYYQAKTRNFAPGKELDDWLTAENDYLKLLIALYLRMAEEDGGMTTVGLQELAKSVGVEGTENINLKIELIQSIQNATRHRPCFRTDEDLVCHEQDCKWRAECHKLVALWCR